MEKILVALLVAGTASFAAISPVAAQSSEAALVKIPFQFVVGDKIMPAGSYRISAQTSDWSVLMISSLDGKAAAAFASTQAIPNPAPHSQNAQVRFSNYYGQYFLQQVALPGRDARVVRVTKAQAERTLTRLSLMPAQRADTAK